MRIMSIVVTLAMTLLSGPAWGRGDNLLPDPGAHSQAAAPETLNIQFQWLDRSPSAEERAVMERAGRGWASRIRAYPIEYRSAIVGPLTLTQAGYYPLRWPPRSVHPVRRDRPRRANRPCRPSPHPHRR